MPWVEAQRQIYDFMLYMQGLLVKAGSSSHPRHTGRMAHYLIIYWHIISLLLTHWHISMSVHCQLRKLYYLCRRYNL